AVAHPLGDLAPQSPRLHHIRLVDLADAAAALSRQLAGDADDALDLGLAIDFGVDAPAAPVGQGLDPARRAEIDPAGQLAYDHQLETGDELTLEARRVGECVEYHGRTQIGEQIHLLAQPQDAALGTQLERQLVPFRPTHGAEQHGVAGERLG